jgi:F5/8 type C domain-containing protein
MLLGLGSVASQTRVDFNRLHGADSSSGTNPFASPSNLNDGSDSTHADRAADPYASAYIVQSRTFDGSSGPPTTAPSSFANPVTAGNILVMVGRSGWSGFDPSATAPPQVTLSDGLTGRPFTGFFGTMFQSTAPGNVYFPMTLGYRVATGDEQTLRVMNQQSLSKYWYTLYEIANAASPGSWPTVGPNNGNSASTAKVIGTLSSAGILEIMALCYGTSAGGDRPLDQTAGTGWTQDVQTGFATGGGNYVYNHAVAHAFGRTDPNWSGGSTIWAGGAVAIPTGKPDATSICQADLGAAYPVNRLRLLESSATGTQYAVSYSTDGTTWTAVTPTFTDLGGGWQQYDLPSTISARYWRIADGHSPAAALSALTWDTWTIEGFPF